VRDTVKDTKIFTVQGTGSLL